MKPPAGDVEAGQGADIRGGDLAGVVRDALVVKAREVGLDVAFFSLTDRVEVHARIQTKEPVDRFQPWGLGCAGVEGNAFVLKMGRMAQHTVTLGCAGGEEVGACVRVVKAEGLLQREGHLRLGGSALAGELCSLFEFLCIELRPFGHLLALPFVGPDAAGAAGVRIDGSLGVLCDCARFGRCT